MERLESYFDCGRTDHDTAFMSLAIKEWAYQRGVQMDFTRPGKSTDNGHIEAFKGLLRGE